MALILLNVHICGGYLLREYTNLVAWMLLMMVIPIASEQSSSNYWVDMGNTFYNQGKYNQGK